MSKEPCCSLNLLEIGSRDQRAQKVGFQGRTADFFHGGFVPPTQMHYYLESSAFYQQIISSAVK
jgi:hypothetical protein